MVRLVLAVFVAFFQFFIIAGFVIGLIGFFGQQLYGDDVGLILVGLKLAGIGLSVLAGGLFVWGVGYLVQSSWERRQL